MRRAGGVLGEVGGASATVVIDPKRPRGVRGAAPEACGAARWAAPGFWGVISELCRGGSSP